MKMEHVIRAPRAVVVDAVPWAVGDFVDEGRELVRFKA